MLVNRATQALQKANTLTSQLEGKDENHPHLPREPLFFNCRGGWARDQGYTRETLAPLRRQDALGPNNDPLPTPLAMPTLEWDNVGDRNKDPPTTAQSPNSST